MCHMSNTARRDESEKKNEENFQTVIEESTKNAQKQNLENKPLIVPQLLNPQNPPKNRNC